MLIRDLLLSLDLRNPNIFKLKCGYLHGKHEFRGLGLHAFRIVWAPLSTGWKRWSGLGDFSDLIGKLFEGWSEKYRKT